MQYFKYTSNLFNDSDGYIVFLDFALGVFKFHRQIFITKQFIIRILHFSAFVAPSDMIIQEQGC